MADCISSRLLHSDTGLLMPNLFLPELPMKQCQPHDPGRPGVPGLNGVLFGLHYYSHGFSWLLLQPGESHTSARGRVAYLLQSPPSLLSPL